MIAARSPDLWLTSSESGGVEPNRRCTLGTKYTGGIRVASQERDECRLLSQSGGEAMHVERFALEETLNEMPDCKEGLV